MKRPRFRGRWRWLGLLLVPALAWAAVLALVPTEWARARGVPLWSEFELAARWSDLPFVAITGTDGKTTVTTLVTDMLRASGRRVVDAGNNDLPLVDAIDHDVPLPVITAALFARFTSRGGGEYTAKVLAALRNQFGGHAVEKVS